MEFIIVVKAKLTIAFNFHFCIQDESKTGENSIQLMGRLCKFIYAKDNTDRIRTRAMLCHIYHHALHDNWYEARDLMLMSHLQDNIHHSDVPTQVRVLLGCRFHLKR